MTTTPVPTRRFTSDTLAGLDGPVRRYFSHASLSVGRWFKSPRYAPFFRAEISAVTPAF